MGGACQAFLIPSAILVALVIVKKIRLTVLLVYIGFGLVWSVASLILIPIGSRGRQLPWPTVVAWALAAGLLGVLGLALNDGLMRILGRPNTGTAVKELNSLLRPDQGETSGQNQ
jgi:hypothetical protein